MTNNSRNNRHSRESGNPAVTCTLEACYNWIPAFAGMTFFLLFAASSFAAVSQIQTPEDKILSKAFAAYMDGDDRSALSYFEEVVRINPRNVAAERGLDKVKVRLRKKDDIEKSKAKRLAEAKMKEGKAFLRSGDNIGAIDSFHAAIDAVPGHKGALSEMNSIRKDADRVLKRQGFNPSSWAFARGTLAYLDRDWAKAYRIWSERHTLEPANVPLANATARAENNFKHMMVTEQEDFFRRSARAFYEQGLFVQAQNSWDKVIELRGDDQEALEGKARAAEAILKAEGKGRDQKGHDLLEEGLEKYATQDWPKALAAFEQLSQLSPDYQNIANDYIARIKSRYTPSSYVPAGSSASGNWRASKPSNQGSNAVDVPDKLENFSSRIDDLKSQLNRDPGNIRAQQELDRVKKSQDDESERIYKDGLIAYSQGNRDDAIKAWRRVLVIDPEHKKAASALKKAMAEQERKE
jgi:tetratricopeptide (TPR) repeat protein